MKKMLLNKVIAFIEPNIQEFHKKRLENLLKLKLGMVLTRKNPYLFKAKNLNTAQDLVKSLLDAHLSSQEEGIFGGFLEQLAIFICSEVYGGRKSTAEGIDLEFEKEGKKYIVSVKSGPNWGNSQQIERMKENFKKARRIGGTNAKEMPIIAINGCCYGKDNTPNKGDYFKLCGQEFWFAISGDMNFYTDIIEPLGYKAKEKNENFDKEYSKVINKFTKQFIDEYCTNYGTIDWDKLVMFNSKWDK
jgi:hypothetical protein